jgi:hypothetical protein
MTPAHGPSGSGGGRKRPLTPVTPKTVVPWHRVGFRLYWGLALAAPDSNWKKTNQQRAARTHRRYGSRRSHPARLADSIYRSTKQEVVSVASVGLTVFPGRLPRCRNHLVLPE